MNKEIQKELDRIMEDTNYSQKGHFSASAIYSCIHFSLGIIVSVLSFIAVTILLSNPTNLTIITYLALSAGIISTISTFIDPDKKHREHLKAANLYLTLRNDARIFKNIKIQNLNEEQTIRGVETFNDRRNNLNEEMPQIHKWAFLLARKNIKDGQLKYEVDKNN